MSRRKTLSVLLAGAGLFAFGCGEQAAAGEMRSEVYQVFKGRPEELLFHLRGPDAAQCVKFELDGLRITLPPGHPGDRAATGVVTRAVVRGDFEISTGFEILQEPAGVADGQSRCSLVIDLDKPNKNMAILSRQAGTTVNSQFLTWVSLWDETSGTDQRKSKPFTTKMKQGRLRLQRHGKLLSFHVAAADDSEFKKLEEFEFGTEDLMAVHLVGATSGKQAALDVRFLDLRLRAESLPGLARAAAAGTAEENDAAERVLTRAAGRVLAIIGMLVAITFLVALAVRHKWGKPTNAPRGV